MNRTSSNDWFDSYLDKSIGSKSSPRSASRSSQQREPAHPPPTPTLPHTSIAACPRPTRYYGNVKQHEIPQTTYGLPLQGDRSRRSNELRQASLSSLYQMRQQRPSRPDVTRFERHTEPNPKPVAVPMPDSFDDPLNPPSPAPWWETKPQHDDRTSYDLEHITSKPPNPVPTNEMPPPYTATPANSDTFLANANTPDNNSNGTTFCFFCMTLVSRVRYDDHGCTGVSSNSKASIDERQYVSGPRKEVPTHVFHRANTLPAQNQDSTGPSARHDAPANAKVRLGTGLDTRPPLLRIPATAQFMTTAQRPTDSLPKPKPHPVTAFSCAETERLTKVWQPMLGVDKEAAHKAVEDGAKTWAKPMNALLEAMKMHTARAKEAKRKEFFKQLQLRTGVHPDDSSAKEELKTPIKQEKSSIPVPATESPAQPKSGSVNTHPSTSPQDQNLRQQTSKPSTAEQLPTKPYVSKLTQEMDRLFGRAHKEPSTVEKPAPVTEQTSMEKVTSSPTTATEHAVKEKTKQPCTNPRVTTIYPSYTAQQTKKSTWLSVSMPKNKAPSTSSPKTSQIPVSPQKLKAPKKKAPKKGELVALTEEDEALLSGRFEDLNLESEEEDEGWDKIDEEEAWEVVEKM